MKASSLGTAQICFLLVDGCAFILMGCCNHPPVSGLGSSLTQFLAVKHSSACCHSSACALLSAKDLGGSWPVISRNEFKKSTSGLARALPSVVWAQLSCFCYHHR